jgi:hypothetical protein
MRRNPYKEYKEGRTGKLWEEDPFEKDFDKNGELNAYNTKDAGNRINDILRRASSQRTEVIRKSLVGDDVKRKVLTAAAKDPNEGMKIIAQVLGEVVYKIVDYAGWARKVLDVDTLNQGEIFRIPKDVDVLGWVVAGDGQTLVSQLRSKYVFPGEFKNTAFVEIDILDVVQANWDIFDRGVDRAAQQVMRGEDVRTYQLLDRVARVDNDVVTYATLDINVLEDLRLQVERHRLTCDKFIINRAELSDLVKLDTTDIDFVTKRELILAGYVGNVLNCQVITSAGIGVEEVVPPGVVLAATEGKYLGRLGERLALQSEEYNALVRGELKKGVAQYEIIGLGSGNSKAAAIATK